MSALTLPLSDPAFRSVAARAFGKGALFILILLAMLAAWCVMRADDTTARLADRLASKTVAIESIAAEQSPDSGGLLPSDLITPDESVAPPSPAAMRTDTPFQTFRKAVPLATGQTQIAVVLTNIGISDSLTRAAIDRLPEDVTLAVSPYSPMAGADADDAAAFAAASGFERWMMLPLAPAGYPATGDAGPLSIPPDGDLAVAKDHTARLIALAQNGYAGFVAPPRHGFDAQAVEANPVFNALAEQGYALADARAQGNDAAAAFARSRAVPYSRTDEFLARNTGRAELQAILQRAEKLSQMNGRAIVMAEATPLSLDMLAEWIAKLPGRNIQLVPLSALSR